MTRAIKQKYIQFFNENNFIFLYLLNELLFILVWINRKCYALECKEDSDSYPIDSWQWVQCLEIKTQTTFKFDTFFVSVLFLIFRKKWRIIFCFWLAWITTCLQFTFKLSIVHTVLLAWFCYNVEIVCQYRRPSTSFQRVRDNTLYKFLEIFINQLA